MRCTLVPRRDLATVGIAPLTSMFFIGENDRHHSDDYRPELHDSDGLLMQSGGGEWIWRPLRNPKERCISAFEDRNPKGFGLMQRDRVFEDYQDLEAFYHRRPGYWVEPQGEWGEGTVRLVELPTENETHDNIVASWQPKQPYKAGEAVELSYKIRALAETDDLHPGGRVVNTYVARTTGERRHGGCQRAAHPALPRRLLGRRPRLLAHRPEGGRDRALDDAGQDPGGLAGAQPPRAGLSRRDRRAARPARAIDRAARLPARPRPDPDRDLDLSVEAA